MEEECIHGLGDPAWCTICNGRESREQAAANAVLYTFAAKYDGKMSCGHHVEIGDALARLADGRFICVECAS